MGQYVKFARDIVWIPAGVKHWHGAASETAMSHIAIAESLDGKVVDWMEHVTDEEYAAGKNPEDNVMKSGAVNALIISMTLSLTL